LECHGRDPPRDLDEVHLHPLRHSFRYYPN
jgi:hypothetical protein